MKKLSELMLDPGFQAGLPYLRKVTVSALPEHLLSRSDSHYWSLEVEYRGNDKWAVSHIGHTYTVDEVSEYEPQPSSRDDDYLDRSRFSFEDAVLLAEKVAPTLRINRMGVEDFIKWTEEHPQEEY